MRKIFYIFRHGQTDFNKERRWQGCGIDMPLNREGEIQAHELAARLRDKNLQIIYSSPLKRALRTAEIVAAELDIPVSIIPDLREGCFGEAEGMLKDDIAVKYPQIFKDWYSDVNDLDVGFPGGETKRQMQRRMFDVVKGLLSAQQEVVGIASHGSSIRYLLMKFGHKPCAMKNTALFRLEYQDGVWQLEEP